MGAECLPLELVEEIPEEDSVAEGDLADAARVVEVVPEMPDRGGLREPRGAREDRTKPESPSSLLTLLA